MVESLKTIRNIAETSMILREHLIDRLIPTQLELLYLEAQQLIDDYCVEGENESVSPSEYKTGTPY
jgi:hypothetical protein